MVLGSFPLAAGHYRSATASRDTCNRHSEFGWGWYQLRQPAPIQSLYLLYTIARGSTSIDFGENQLSPGLIGLSPLPTSHPNGFQPIPVRASTKCYLSFTLLMGRSPWLRVYPQELDALVAGLAFAPTPRLSRLASLLRSNSPDHNAKGTQSAVTRVAPSPASYRL